MYHLGGVRHNVFSQIWIKKLFIKIFVNFQKISKKISKKNRGEKVDSIPDLMDPSDEYQK